MLNFKSIFVKNFYPPDYQYDKRKLFYSKSFQVLQKYYKKRIDHTVNPFFVIFILNVYYSLIRISKIWLADLATEEPGPKIAATPALYKKS